MVIRKSGRCTWVKTSVHAWERETKAERNILKYVSNWNTSHKLFTLSINIYFHLCTSCFAAKNKTFRMSLSFTSCILQSLYLYLLSISVLLTLASLHLIFQLTPRDPHIAISTPGNVHCSFSNYPAGFEVLRPKGQASKCRKPCCHFHHCTR